jgi:hypothetical protein
MSGTAVPVSVSPNCNGAFDHIRWSMGPRDGNTETGYVLMSGGATTGTFDSTTVSDGSYQASAAVYAPDGSLIGWWAPLAYNTVSNGGGMPGLVPNGVAPPAGRHWQLTFHDEFAEDAPGNPNSSLWNGGTGGLPSTFCTGPGPDSNGYTGDDCESYFGTYPDAPYEQVIPGLGLAVQATHAAPGDNNYYDNKLAAVNTSTKFIQKFGYFEWSAKLPSDQHGEGDGWHTDLWCTSPNRTVNHGPEIDLNEKVYGTGNQNYTNFTVFDDIPASSIPVIDKTYGAPGNPDLSAAFHTYGLAWRDDGLGKYGSIQGYVDGQPIAVPVPLNHDYWDAGMWCWGGWMQQTAFGWGGGSAVSASTSDDNPLYIRYFRVWQAE